LPQGIWALAAVQQQKPDFEIRSFAYPGQTAADAMSVGAADMALSIASTSKNKAAAENLLNISRLPKSSKNTMMPMVNPHQSKAFKLKAKHQRLRGLHV
jgi:raffinose/stachyose/melibiose transport system substrate-binding protein